MFKENKDILNSYYTPKAAATNGAAVGGARAFEVAYDANARANSAMSIPYGIWEEQDRINDMLEAQDEPRIPKTFYSATLHGDKNVDLDLSETIDGTGLELTGSARSVQQYNARVLELRKKRPDLDLPTVGEQYKRVREKARAAEAEQEDINYSGIGGYIAAFAGQVLSDLNPALNPVNTATLGVGGFGKSVVGRIFAEAGANAGIELVNQLTGIREQRELLGLETGAGHIAQSVIAAGVGAGLLQGTFEGAAKLAGKYFPSTKIDPAPEPPPTPLRRGEAPPAGMDPKTAAFLVAERDAMGEMNALPNRDWKADSVRSANPYGDGRLAEARFTEEVDAAESSLDWAGTDADKPATVRTGEDIDQAARAIDPKAFDKYDAVRAEIERVKANLESQRAYEAKTNGDNISEITKANMQEKQDYIAFLESETRASVMPLMVRAYAKARESTPFPSKETRAAVEAMVADNMGSLPPSSAARVKQRKALPVEGPIAKELSDMLGRSGRSIDETRTTALARAAETDYTGAVKNVEAEIANVPQILSGEKELALPEGVDLDTPLRVVDREGRVETKTVRELLEEIGDDELELEAVTKCSLKTS